MARAVWRSMASSLIELVQASRFWLVVVIEILFIWLAFTPLYSYVSLIGYRVNPCVLPLLASDPLYQLVFLFGLVLVFADAPFLTENQLFVLMRGGRLAWGLGKILYLVVVSVLYWLLLVAASLILLAPCASLLTDGWGAALSTLAETDAASQIGLSFGVNSYLLNTYQPFEALTLMFAMESLAGAILGLLIMAVNLATRNKGGLAAAILVVLLDLLIVNALPYRTYSWSIASHGRLVVFSEVDPFYPTLGYAAGFDGVCAAVLAVAVLVLVWKTDLMARSTM
ncbi:MAG: hypothetical protein UCH28_08530 [Adlercreutzia sp.]|nr:hypothetical protein [Adlercreutzia sp.]